MAKTAEQVVRDAMGSGSLKRMVAVLDVRCAPVTRHFLLQSLVQEAYRLRARRGELHQLCVDTGRKHIAEFPSIKPHLEQMSGGSLPRIPSFAHLVTALTESARFDEALDVCNKAIEWKAPDGTKGGFHRRAVQVHKARAAFESGGSLPKPRALKPRVDATAEKALKRKQRASPVPPLEPYSHDLDAFNEKQRAFYDLWKHDWSQGTARPVNSFVSYLFCYAVEVVQGDAATALGELQRLVAAYDALGERHFVKYCRHWITDCYILLGQFREALESLPTPTLGMNQCGIVDLALSLRVQLQLPPTPRELLTLQRPAVTPWGRERLTAIEERFGDLLKPHESRLLPALTASTECKRHAAFLGLSTTRSSGLSHFQFSRSPQLLAFVKQLTREAENLVRHEHGKPPVRVARGAGRSELGVSGGRHECE